MIIIDPIYCNIMVHDHMYSDILTNGELITLCGGSIYGEEKKVQAYH